jgi:phosphoribosylformylglycinamidine cyclo-ligase
MVRDLGRVPQDDLERTLNLGVGMVAVVAAGGAAAAQRRLAARGIQNWVLGEVTERGDADDDVVVRGAKGADGGGVRLVGTHPAW